MSARRTSDEKGLPKGSPFFRLMRRVARRVARLAVPTAVRGATLLSGVAMSLAAQAAEGPPLTAAPASTRLAITLHARDGSAVRIGHVDLAAPVDGTRRFGVTMDHAVFTDHFLSMREFKCLPGGSEILCHVPYPYPQPGTLREGDAAWLEHALLFMFKKPSEFGAKLWNGVYWRLQRTERGWRGTPQAVDLNLIGAPPEKPGPPYPPARRDDMPAGARWFERITIE